MDREPIAIIGIGCRFPGAKNPEAFWELLCNGIDAITEVPPSRWDRELFYDPDPTKPGKMNTRWGGFLEQVDEFDPLFFGISPRETQTMDPQQRLLLELAWEALEDAGQAPEELAGTPTGVFMGVSSFDYYELIAQNPSNFSTYTGTGNINCINANRLSYFFDFQGPSMAIDTACSSSLVAVHLACQSLWSGESTLALVGGVHIMTSPWMSVAYSQAGFMAPNGRCKTFDATADGYVRSEGAGLVILKPLSQALANGDRIYAVIRGSAVNQDGYSNGLTAPNPLAQEAMLRAAYQNAGISPGQVQYIEAHGTGTKLGDPMEMKALGAVLSQDRAPGDYCAVGSAKTNIGHLEAAAGIVGLIKVALSLHYRLIPPSLHFQEPNPYIKFDKLPLRVQETLTPWPEKSIPAIPGRIALRIAGVSSFGFGGSNSHVVLAEVGNREQGTGNREKEGLERPVHLLTLSAKTPKALEELVSRYRNHLENKNNAELELADICYTANTGRAHFKHRLAAIATSKQELAKKLHHFQAEEVTGLFSGQFSSSAKSPKVAFLFTDQGSQYVQMGKNLYQKSLVFRQAIDQCDKILRGELEHPLLSVLYPETTDNQTSLLDQPAYSQPALFAMEYALAQLWQSWGIQPNMVMGNNVGEYVAACVAKVFSLEDGLKLIVTRGRLMQESHTGGEAEFEAVAKQVTYTQPQIPLISNVTGKRVGNEITLYQYWVNHMRQTVGFAESIQTLHQEGCKLFLEIGPKPVLLGMDDQSLPESAGVWLPSLHPPQEDWQQMLSSLGQLYVKGVKVDWSGFDRDYPRRKVALPTYPFQRQRYWLESSEKGNPEDPLEHSSSLIVNLLNQGDTERLAQEFNFAEQLTAQEQQLLPKLLKILIARHQDDIQSSEQCLGILQQLKKAPERDRLQLMTNYLQRVVGQLLGFDNTQSPDSQLGLFDMGMNYSMMLKLINQLQTSFGCSLSVTTLSEHVNIQELARYLIIRIFGGELEEKLEIDKDSHNPDRKTVDSEREPLGEDAIANAIQEEMIATAINEELKDIQLLLSDI